MCDEVILFTKPGCQKCDYVKGKIPDNLDVDVKDMTTPDGLAHAAYYELIEKTTPILVVNDNVVEGAVKIKNKMDEIAKIGKKE